MNLAVLGATGGTGALTRGHRVTALVRSAVEPRAGLTVVRGDPHEIADLRRALAGADAVISTLGPRGLGKTTLVADCARATLVAMRELGVRRLVIVGVGALFRQGIVPRLLRATVLRNIAADAAEMERVVTASEVDWTIARAPRLTHASQTGYAAEDDCMPARVVTAASLGRAGLARFLLDEVDHPNHVRRIVGVAGAQD